METDLTHARRLSRQGRILGALMLRELVTRYGRRGLGFLWLIGEPLIFCLGVLILWSAIRSDYEHGVRLGPFIMTGYMCLLLMRHQITLSLGALQANVGLLYHRDVSVLHIYASRNLLEFLGATAAFAIVYLVLLALGEARPPADWATLYGGWLLMALIGSGLALIFSGLALRHEVMERIAPLFTYLLIPLSGVFFMAAWAPPAYRDILMLIPIPHAVEMVRAGVFGEFVETHFNPLYALVWGVALNAAGLLLLADARERIDIE